MNMIFQFIQVARYLSMVARGVWVGYQQLRAHSSKPDATEKRGEEERRREGSNKHSRSIS